MYDARYIVRPAPRNGTLTDGEQSQRSSGLLLRYRAAYTAKGDYHSAPWELPSYIQARETTAALRGNFHFPLHLIFELQELQG